MCGEKTKKMCGFKFKVIEIQFSSKISSKLVFKFKGKNLGAKKARGKNDKQQRTTTFYILFQNFI